MPTYAQRLRLIAQRLDSTKPTDPQRDEIAAELQSIAHALCAPDRTPLTGAVEAENLVTIFLLNALTELAKAVRITTDQFRLEIADSFINHVIDGLASNELGRAMELLIAHKRPKNRDHLVLTVADSAKRWWITVRDKANHARMSTVELKLWQATRALKQFDGEATP